MKICFNDSLCRKCPHNGKEWCDYKKDFYEQAPPKNDEYILIHRCQEYEKLFSPGQVVYIDLYHTIRTPCGGWEDVPAFLDVPGVIRGIRGSKYQVELFEAVVLSIRGKGNPKRELEQLYLRVSKSAKEIRKAKFGYGDFCNPKSLIFDEALEPAVFN